MKKLKWTGKTSVLLSFAVALSLGLAGCGSMGGQGSDAEVITENGNTENGNTESGNTENGNTESGTLENREEESSNAGNSGKDVRVRIGSLKGPTTMGLLFFQEQEKVKNNDKEPEFEFHVAASLDEILPLMAKGEMDIALIPANAASLLYHKTKGGVTVIDINSLGVLYMVTGDAMIKEISDLRGKTIYLTGKGTVPDYVIHYILKENGLSEGDYKLEYKSDTTEVAALLAKQPEAVGMLPQPFATAACAQNEKLIPVLDMNEEWNKLQGQDGSRMITGVTIVRNEFLKENEEAVAEFLRQHKESARAINEDVEKGAELVVAADIIPKAEVAVKAIPKCNITYIDGDSMKQALEGFLQVLFLQNPESVGGNMPGDDFYYIP